MKKYILMSILCSVLLISGCGSTKNQISNPQTAEQIENTNTMPNEAEIANAYYKALEAYSWFDAESLAYQETESNDDVESVEDNGKVFYKINVTNLETYEDLQKYLRALFSEDIVQRLLNPDHEKTALYKDINGQLFGTIYARVTDSSKGKQEYDIIKESETKFIFKVIVHLRGNDMKETGEVETHEFNYEYINGKWVFTNFYIFL